jgi:hypothetical protein
MGRTRDISNIFDDNSPIVNDNELIIAINTASAAAAAYADSELAVIDLSSTIQTASAAAVSYLVDSAPSALDTLNELAAALNDDQNFATSILTTISSASASTLSAANLYTDNATPDLTPAIQAASAAAVAYTDQEVAAAILTASAAAASYTDSELSSIDLTATIVTASAAAAAYADNLIANLAPLISGISPDNISGTASTAVVVNGQNFQSGSIVKLIDINSTELFTLSTTFNNERSLQFLTPALTASAGPYDIKVTNPDNQLSILENALNVGTNPAWVTNAGSLGLIYNSGRSSTTFTVQATDVDSHAITYSIVSGSLPTNMTMTNQGVISGTAQAVASDTTYAFTVRATDTSGASNERSFSITTKAPVVQSFTTVGTTSWTALAGGAIEVLVVAGGGRGGDNHSGGGGGGGVIYNGSFSVTKDSSYGITVGAGGSGTYGQIVNGQNSVFHSLTAIGGGGGAGEGNNDLPGANGGCGGGGSGHSVATAGGNGTVGQGFNGAAGYDAGSSKNGGGGGGAGGAGQTGQVAKGGDGGVGFISSISGSSQYYAGGGGGGAWAGQGRTPGLGGLGGGQNGGPSGGLALSGSPNTGGGGGGGGEGGGTGGSGGSGIVILRY